MVKWSPVVVLVCACGFAQPLSLGIKAGVPLTDFVTAGAAPKRYILGGAVEVRLSHGFGVEFDALVRRASYYAWEFPLLVKYRFRGAIAKPFGDAGVALDTLGGIEARHTTVKGLVAGAGVELRSGRLRFSPEVRFTHWGDRHFGTATDPVRSNLNQAEFLLGISF